MVIVKRVDFIMVNWQTPLETQLRVIIFNISVTGHRCMQIIECLVLLYRLFQTCIDRICTEGSFISKYEEKIQNQWCVAFTVFVFYKIFISNYSHKSVELISKTCSPFFALISENWKTSFLVIKMLRKSWKCSYFLCWWKTKWFLFQICSFYLKKKKIAL